jgi:hypothetical protein
LGDGLLLLPGDLGSHTRRQAGCNDVAYDARDIVRHVLLEQREGRPR